MFRSNGDAHSSFLNVEMRVRRIVLRVDVLFVPIVLNLVSSLVPEENHQREAILFILSLGRCACMKSHQSELAGAGNNRG